MVGRERGRERERLIKHKRHEEKEEVKLSINKIKLSR